MTAVVTGLLLAMAAASLGLRTTAVLIPRVHPLLRLVASLVIGAALVVASLRLANRYLLYDLGLGLLVSLSPVGVYDLAKWWFYTRARRSA
ncbi:MAG TPA: hypothetical protein VF491_10615 [Vicinamibacterales bacterium]|jgi:hypothetical protein